MTATDGAEGMAQAMDIQPKIAPRCLQPWQTLMIDASGVVQPCAYRGNYTNTLNAEPLGNVNERTLDEIWNGQIAQRVRRCMAAGDLVGAGCGECLALKQGHALGLEIAKNVVPGTAYARNLQHKRDEIAVGATVLRSRPTVLYYTPSHHCNLRCVHCYQGTSRDLSVREAADDQVLDLLPVLSDVVAGGGEPLILPLWRRLLSDYRPELNPHLRFCTTTNALFLRDDVIDHLERLPSIALIVSIDGLGDRFEQIRLRANWAQFETNMRRLHALCRRKGSPFGLNVSVMKQNVEQLPALVELATELETLVNFQPVVSYPIDCSLRCFNAPPVGWEAHFDAADAALGRLTAALKRAGDRFKGWDNLWSFDSQEIQSTATRDLVPWSLFERLHDRMSIEVPPDKRPAVDFVRSYSREKNWPRGTACVVFAEEGVPEPHWYGIVEDDYRCEVSLPKGRYDAWVVQIDSVPLNSTYAMTHNASWRVEV